MKSNQLQKVLDILEDKSNNMSTKERQKAVLVHDVLKNGESVSPQFAAQIKTMHAQLRAKHGDQWRTKAGIPQNVHYTKEESEHPIGSHVTLHSSMKGGPEYRAKIVGKDKDDLHVEYNDLLGANRVKTVHKSFVKESEQIDETNWQAFGSAGKIHPDLANYMEVGRDTNFWQPKTGKKSWGNVKHKSPSAIHIQADKEDGGKLHKFKISTQLHEEFEQIDELSNGTLANYKRLAGKEASQADIEAIEKPTAASFLRKKADKRFSGIVKATNKQFTNDMKQANEEVDLDESYASPVIRFETAEQAQKRVDKLKKAHNDGNYYVKSHPTAGHKVAHAYHSDYKVSQHILGLKEEVEIDESADIDNTLEEETPHKMKSDITQKVLEILESKHINEESENSSAPDLHQFAKSMAKAHRGLKHFHDKEANVHVLHPHEKGDDITNYIELHHAGTGKVDYHHYSDGNYAVRKQGLTHDQAHKQITKAWTKGDADDKNWHYPEEGKSSNKPASHTSAPAKAHLSNAEKHSPGTLDHHLHMANYHNAMASTSPNDATHRKAALEHGEQAAKIWQRNRAG